MIPILLNKNYIKHEVIMKNIKINVLMIGGLIGGCFSSSTVFASAPLLRQGYEGQATPTVLSSKDSPMGSLLPASALDDAGFVTRFVSACGSSKVVDFLAYARDPRAKLTINTTDDVSGETPVTAALKASNKSAIRFMFTQGVRSGKCNRSGETPCDIIAESPDVAAMFDLVLGISKDDERNFMNLCIGWRKTIEKSTQANIAPQKLAILHEGMKKIKWEEEIMGAIKTQRPSAALQECRDKILSAQQRLNDHKKMELAASAECFEKAKIANQKMIERQREFEIDEQRKIADQNEQMIAWARARKFADQKYNELMRLTPVKSLSKAEQAAKKKETLQQEEDQRQAAAQERAQVSAKQNEIRLAQEQAELSKELAIFARKEAQDAQEYELLKTRLKNELEERMAIEAEHRAAQRAELMKAEKKAQYDQKLAEFVQKRDLARSAAIEAEHRATQEVERIKAIQEVERIKAAKKAASIRLEKKAKFQQRKLADIQKRDLAKKAALDQVFAPSSQNVVHVVELPLTYDRQVYIESLLSQPKCKK